MVGTRSLTRPKHIFREGVKDVPDTVLIILTTVPQYCEITSWTVPKDMYENFDLIGIYPTSRRRRWVEFVKPKRSKIGPVQNFELN